MITFLHSFIENLPFLAHLSRRLTDELIGYPWIRRPLSSVRRPSVHIFKHLLLQNRLANQSQILCGASLGRGNESLYNWSRSHDQDGRHAHIYMVETLKNFLLQNRCADFQETWYVASGTPAHHTGVLERTRRRRVRSLGRTLIDKASLQNVSVTLIRALWINEAENKIVVVRNVL